MARIDRSDRPIEEFWRHGSKAGNRPGRSLLLGFSHASIPDSLLGLLQCGVLVTIGMAELQSAVAGNSDSQSSAVASDLVLHRVPLLSVSQILIFGSRGFHTKRRLYLKIAHFKNFTRVITLEVFRTIWNWEIRL